MNSLLRFLSSSIGKKVQMALTGLLLCGFLVVHLAGNLFLYKDAETFNHYARALEGNLLLPAAEIGLAALFVLHIITALRATWENRRARPVAYEASRPAGGSTFSSRMMVFSALVLFAFLVVHLKTFRFPAEKPEDIYRLVMAAFSNKFYASFYVLAMGALALHLNHGFQSGFQTLGVSHPRYTPWIRGFGCAFAWIVALGFASIAFWAGFLIR
ncbi:MAG: succinate dehydrogenase cytochrome b subunit [Elusimicrobia bacterium]|nr:succinate dehydrogenase cytochrome b subunit [Elusimicrobiota bacterium]